MNTPENNSHPMSLSSGCCGRLNRRDVLKLIGTGTASALAGAWPVTAGPFEASDFKKLVPADKKLSPNWVRSLFERSAPTVYRGKELEMIGMPVGGICCGQVYLGGDGRLWHWDIFNSHIGTGSEHYAKPMLPASPFDQGFALCVTMSGKRQVRPLDRTGWAEVSFKGQYPIGNVEYRDADCPVCVSLEAFSPFIPQNTDDSSLPATVMQFTLRNSGAGVADVELAGWLENAICLHSGPMHALVRKNRIVRRHGLVFLECSAQALPPDLSQKRPDIAFEDFEKPIYEGWTASGTALGQGPVAQKQVPDYQGELGMRGRRAVNTHASAPGDDVAARDAAKGTLTSKAFVIERHFITFLIGGGGHPGKTCLNLLVDDKVVASATGANGNRMQPRSLDARRWAGRTGRLQIVDDESGGWGNIGLDHIVFSDMPSVPPGPLEEEPDFGTMGLALLNVEAGDSGASDFTVSAMPPGKPAEVVFATLGASDDAAVKPLGEPLTGALERRLTLAPGAAATVTGSHRAASMQATSIHHLQLRTTWPRSSRASAARPTCGMTRGTIPPCLTGSSIVRSSMPRSLPPRPVFVSGTGVSMVGRVWVAALAPAATSGSMPRLWRDCSRS
jgi:non-lysosomal glucosylceramidase